MKLATLGDVRVLFDKHLSAEYRAKFGWRQLAALLRRRPRSRGRGPSGSRAATGPTDRARALPRRVAATMNDQRRRFPPSWTVEEYRGISYIIRDANNFPIAY